ncbi:MAG: histidine triad (HIT) family protein [Bacteroidetes bacterium HLUCCA01]|nr:MAG: histidine triad (HIT) family protein [Bacteroidetes bacterium HLUCCA01]
MASIFTKIINGEIPSYKIAENEHYYAFLDINPAAKGHTLVVPKLETDYLFDLPDEVLGGLMQFAKPIARALDAAFQPIRTGVIVEGLEVPHAHVHLIPMYADRRGFSLGKKVDFTPEEMAEIVAAVRSALDAG